MIVADKRLLITGVRNRRSLAYSVAARAKAHGARLAFAVQPVDKAHDKTSALISEDFPDAAIFPCDAACDSDIANTTAAAAKQLDGLDGMVHSIAYAERETLIGDYYERLSRDSFSKALDISAYTFTAFAKAALPYMPETGGSMVTLTYLGAERALPSYNVMGVAKAALEASVRYLAFSMGKHSVRVNAISAGPVKTLSASGIGGFGKILKLVEQQAPLKRNISAEEVGDAATFLLSDMARAVTGEVIHVDAGFHITAGFSDETPS